MTLRRVIVLALIYLLCGFVVNVLVAWGAALFREPDGMMGWANRPGRDPTFIGGPEFGLKPGHDHGPQPFPAWAFDEFMHDVAEHPWDSGWCVASASGWPVPALDSVTFYEFETTFERWPRVLPLRPR